MAALLLDRGGGADVNVIGGRGVDGFPGGCTALLWALAEYSNDESYNYGGWGPGSDKTMEIVRFLLERGADPRVQCAHFYLGRDVDVEDYLGMLERRADGTMFPDVSRFLGVQQDGYRIGGVVYNDDSDGGDPDPNQPNLVDWRPYDGDWGGDEAEIAEIRRLVQAYENDRAEQADASAAAAAGRDEKGSEDAEDGDAGAAGGGGAADDDGGREEKLKGRRQRTRREKKEAARREKKEARRRRRR